MKASRLILNGVNGRYPREIQDNIRIGDCDLVEAAIAYVSDDSLLLEWCWSREIPLRLYARFDETVPVAPWILKRFLERRSGRFVCKLLTHFHAKVIWWHGVGAYIGSANLSQAAWHGNIEAGVYFEESDMIRSGLDEQLSGFFRQVEGYATPLTDELYKAIEWRHKQLNRHAETDRDQKRSFLETTAIRKWNGLAHISAKTATDQRKQEFLDERFRTLQILRDIGKRVSDDANRPSWLPAGVPIGGPG